MRLGKISLKGIAWVVIGVGLPLAPICAKELARVNDTVISDKDLEMALGSLNEGQRSGILKDVYSRRQIVQQLVEREMIVEEGKKFKYDQEPRFKDQANLMQKQLLMNTVLDKKFASQLTLPSVKKYYETHKALFSTDQVHIQHILVTDPTEAKKMLEMAQKPDADFQDLAEKSSKDPSAKNNRGDLGFIGRGRFVPEFTEAAFGGSSGEIVGPVKTIYGYHIIKVIEKRLGKPLEFDEVEGQARAALRQELMRNYVDGLKGQMKVKIDTAAIEKY